MTNYTSAPWAGMEGATTNISTRGYEDPASLDTSFADDLLYDEPTGSNQPLFGEFIPGMTASDAENITQPQWPTTQSQSQVLRAVVTGMGLPEATVEDLHRSSFSPMTRAPHDMTRHPIMGTPPSVLYVETGSHVPMQGHPWQKMASFPGAQPSMQPLTNEVSFLSLPPADPSTPGMSMASSFGQSPLLASPTGHPSPAQTRGFEWTGGQQIMSQQYAPPFHQHVQGVAMRHVNNALNTPTTLPYAQHIGSWAVNAPPPTTVPPAAVDQVNNNQVDLPLRCSAHKCPKTFRTYADLRHHERYHGVREKACSVCGKKFFFDKDVKRHEKIHRTDRPFACRAKGCGKSYRRKDHLERHRERKHGSQ